MKTQTVSFEQALEIFSAPEYSRKYNGKWSCGRCGAVRLADNELRSTGCVECENTEDYQFDGE